jgi:hypothetical protein
MASDRAADVAIDDGGPRASKARHSNLHACEVFL